jgi:NAD(P)-dependent dehydrogenase (short-subunit alcohol dehydrogenase family)
MGGLIGFAGVSPYIASKHAVMGLTRSAALDYAKQGIRINAVNPGLIATEMMDRFSSKDFTLEQYASSVPMGRMGKDEWVNLKKLPQPLCSYVLMLPAISRVSL